MLSIVQYPNPVLTRPCQRVTKFDGLSTLVDQMVEAMYASGGVGLAAPQVNVNQRVLVFDPTGGEEANRVVVLVNPEVTWVSSEVVVSTEGCLSLPAVSVEVKRYCEIDVCYDDTSGMRRTLRFDGFSARIVQHEIDHLDGVLMIDRVGPLVRRLALLKQRA